MVIKVADLKSNMDRFIVIMSMEIRSPYNNLKSNMDRFIAMALFQR